MTDIADAPRPTRADRRDKSIAAAPNFDLLAGVSLRVSVEVGSTAMTLSELLALGEGSVIARGRGQCALATRSGNQFPGKSRAPRKPRGFLGKSHRLDQGVLFFRRCDRRPARGLCPHAGRTG